MVGGGARVEAGEGLGMEPGKIERMVVGQE